jgi:lipopolysaccharide transport system permease protein
MIEQDSLPQVPHLVIRPRSGWRALNLKEMWQSRDLLWTLSVRDVIVVYRQTALGALWVILQPLLAAGILSFVFGRVAKLPSENVPYYVFSYAGLLGWNVFGTTLTKVSSSLIRNRAMVEKIFFPRLILPISTVLSTLIDFCVALIVMTVLLATSGRGFGVQMLALPVWVVLMLILAFGIGLVGAALMVSYRDIGHIVPVLSQMIFYASPVAYSTQAIPEGFGWVFSLNPLVGILEGFRWSLIRGGELHLGHVAYSATVAVVVLVFGLFAFARMERKFADVV